MSVYKPKRQQVRPSIFDYLRDIRVIQVIAQIIFVILLVGGLVVLGTSISNTLTERGITVNYRFLERPATFDIAESPESYSPNDSTYGDAIFVGIVNTLRVVSIGLVGATVIGVFVGIFLLSNNWLVKTISRVYVEILRNTPLLVQLYFWYYIIFFALPPYADAIAVPAEGISFVPYKYPVYALLLLIVWFFARRQGYPTRFTVGALGAIVLAEVVSPFIASIFGADFASVLSAIIVMSLALTAVFAPKSWRGLGIGFTGIVIGQWLLLQLFLPVFFYLGLLQSPDTLINPVYPFAFFTVKGLALPEIAVTARFAEWMVFVGVGIALGVAMWNLSGHITETTGKPIARGTYAFVTILIAAVLGWYIIGMEPQAKQIPVGEGDTAQLLTYSEVEEQGLMTREIQIEHGQAPVLLILPERGRFRFDSGTIISPEFAALLVGLVIYTSAFIAEIVRAGIQAVPYGQIEAARALGLSTGQTLQRVILPQALRVIIPPMGNQYLNLAKNSSLAAAIAFADTYQVGQTFMNQSGQSIVGFTLIFIVYITMSLIISLVMNFVNRRFQIVTR